MILNEQPRSQRRWKHATNSNNQEPYSVFRRGLRPPPLQNRRGGVSNQLLAEVGMWWYYFFYPITVAPLLPSLKAVWALNSFDRDADGGCSKLTAGRPKPNPDWRQGFANFMGSSEIDGPAMQTLADLFAVWQYKCITKCFNLRRNEMIYWNLQTP